MNLQLVGSFPCFSYFSNQARSRIFSPTSLIFAYQTWSRLLPPHPHDQGLKVIMRMISLRLEALSNHESIGATEIDHQRLKDLE
jgi:hypothetical protein